MLRFPMSAVRQEGGPRRSLAGAPSQGAKLIWDLLLLERVRPSFWADWAIQLKGGLQRESQEKGDEERLQTCSDLEHIELPERSPWVVDPVISKMFSRRYEPRHQTYFKNMAAWAHYSLRPVSERRARALWAWSAAVIFVTDLIDGWDLPTMGLVADLPNLPDLLEARTLGVDALVAGVPELGTLLDSRRALMMAIERDNEVFRLPQCEASPQLWDAVRIVRRASNLCFGLRPTETWWEDYRREMGHFVHSRLAELILRRCGVKGNANPEADLECCLRSRAMDLGCPAATIVTGLSQGDHPTWSSGITRALAEVQALSWLHRIAVTDLYSYYWQRGEGRGNLLQTVMTLAPKGTPPTLGQGVDCVVRFGNRLWEEFKRQAHQLETSPEGRRSPGLRGHLRELGNTMMGNLDFTRREGTLFQDPAKLDTL